jgi:hypothetical protein
MRVPWQTTNQSMIKSTMVRTLILNSRLSALMKCVRCQQSITWADSSCRERSACSDAPLQRDSRRLPCGIAGTTTRLRRVGNPTVYTLLYMRKEPMYSSSTIVLEEGTQSEVMRPYTYPRACSAVLFSICAVHALAPDARRLLVKPLLRAERTATDSRRH